MPLTEAGRRTAQALLKQFSDSGKSLTNQGVVYPSYRDLDKARLDALPELRRFIDRFLKREIDLQSFKQENNALCIKHNYWGFTGFSGQMTLNQLANWSHGSEPMAELLREALTVPDSKEKAVEKINRVLREMPRLVTPDKKLRAASMPFVLSYFWQIQRPEIIPVYYHSSKKTLLESGLLEANDDPAALYHAFWNLHEELAAEFATAMKTGDNKYWFVEHVLWAPSSTAESAPEPGKRVKGTKVPQKAIAVNGYSDFIPPRLADLLTLSRGESSPIDFEDRVALAFQILGFEVTKLGQGTGRNPDGIAYCREHNYAILFDAKGYKDGYGIGVDDRSVIEYIKTHERDLRKQGYSNIYFCFVSASFRGDGKANTDRIRRETGTKSVVLLSAENLLRLIARKIEHPRDFELGDFQDMLLDSGELGSARLEAFWAD
ncbi:MAG: restriction endonuclease FokI C-terminal domain-containing protein [Elusimicrobiota bacterium]